MHSTTDCSAPREWSDPELIAARLAQVAQRKQLQSVVVGLLADGHELVIGAQNTVALLDPTLTRCAPVHAGCMTKLLTATLVAQAVADGYLDWSSPICDSLDLLPSSRRKVLGVTVRQLLDHTHGLDGSSMDTVPKRGDGFIAVESICERLGTRCIASPGSLYSYSDVGSWFAAAILERIYRESYVSLLYDQGLLAPEKSTGTMTVTQSVCPSVGGALQLTIGQWLAFARRHIDPERQYTGSRLFALREVQTPLPGWHPSERAICLGWKYYGDGWYGHNSNLAHQSAILRVNPAAKIAIIVASEGAIGAFFALAGLFGAVLPEILNIRPPRLLSPDESRNMQYAPYVGVYSQSRTTVAVTMDSEGALMLAAHDRVSDCSVANGVLRPTKEGLFMLRSRNAAKFAFIQFVTHTAERESQYLWNGRQLWRREA